MCRVHTHTVYLMFNFFKMKKAKAKSQNQNLIQNIEYRKEHTIYFTLYVFYFSGKEKPIFLFLTLKNGVQKRIATHGGFSITFLVSNASYIFSSVVSTFIFFFLLIFPIYDYSPYLFNMLMLNLVWADLPFIWNWWKIKQKWWNARMKLRFIFKKKFIYSSFILFF